MSSTQVGKTEILNNVVGYHIDQDPAPILMLQPTIEMGEAWSKDRLAPMLRDTPALHGLVQDPRARDSGNTLRHKAFPGGHITIAGANSPASLASRPIRLLLCDEIDRYPPSAGSEGDPVELARKRTSNFWNRKLGIFSTPTDEGSSAIERWWERSDQRRFWVPCAECGNDQVLIWEQVIWERTGDGGHVPDTARYVCSHCAVPWKEAQRLRAIRNGEWRASAPFTGIAGFHLNAVYSPWAELPELAKDWIASYRFPEKRRVFVNTVKGIPYKEKYGSLKIDDGRTEPYPKLGEQILVPSGVVVITAGVDVQDDRLEVQIQGYGPELEQWKLQYHVIDGDPSAPQVWDALRELLLKPLPMERGGVDYIRATCVDTGAHTLRAYDFCRPRARYVTRDWRQAYVFAIKGQGGAGGNIWPTQPNRNNKGKIPLYNVRVDPVKELLYGALDKITAAGPGFIHFPSEVSTGAPFDDRYFDQLTSEQVVTKTNRAGAVARVWELKSPGMRNEALDTSVYGEAALRGLLMMGLDLNKEAKRIRPRTTEPPPPTPASEEAPEDDGPPDPASGRRRRRRSSRSTWLRR